MSASGDKETKAADASVEPQKRTGQDTPVESDAETEATTEESTDTTVSPDKRTWQ